MEGTMKPPEAGIKVRMYCRGQGDCFLLAIKGSDDEDKYILIDCGFHSLSKREAAELAKHIRDSTGGHLDVVIATHEHTDHINGFGMARKTFKQLGADQVWLAWTENEKDPKVKDIAEEIGSKTGILMKVVERLKASGLQLEADFIKGLLAAKATKEECMKAVREMGAPRYLKQGEGPILLEGLDNVRFYILSPPYDTKFVLKRPASKPDDVYGLACWPLDAENSFLAAAIERMQAKKPKGTKGKATGPPAADTGEAAFSERFSEASQPFDSRYRLSRDDLAGKTEVFFREHYGLDGGTSKAPGWRRIDHDWELTAEHLAIKLNHSVNNTSLVIAIELVDSGKVLLFPGDAQAESWRHWHKAKLSWDVEGDKRTVEDLIKNTVFYKVSHHGSRNGTVKSTGLEIMKETELVAMIPVGKGNTYEHPEQPVVDALMRKAGGRVLRADAEDPGDRPDGASAEDWKKFGKHFESNTDERYVDYTLGE